jgi:putative MATE family efflux protein
MKLFGSRSDAVLGYSKEYGRFILLAAPFMCMCFVMNNVLRAEGKAVYSMFGLIAGAVLNVVLDPIFIFVADMGISGAGLATCISQIVSFCVLLSVYLSGKTVTRIRLRSLSRTASVYLSVIKTGFPSFCRQILASLCTVFLNNAANTYGGDAAQAALGVVQKVFMFAFSISLGIGQGYQPVLGYNYSAKRFDRVKSAYIFTWAFATALMTVFSVVCSIFASTIMGMFSLSAQATEIGLLALRLQCLMMPLLPLNFMAGVTYQVIGKQVGATLLSVSRQGLFYIPSVLLLPKFLGLLGVQACQATADFLAFFFAIPFTVLFFKSLKKDQKEYENLLVTN